MELSLPWTGVRSLVRELRSCKLAKDPVAQLKKKKERKLQVKITTTHLLEWLKPKTLTTTNAGEDAEQQELSVIASGNAKCCSHLGREFGSFLQR